MTLQELNHASAEKFVAVLGAIYEHSPWVAERSFAERPFASVDAVAKAMSAAVVEAPSELQLALVRAHPDLAGKLARAGTLQPASASEQAGLGLDRLSDTEYERFDCLNTEYRRRFGFPFVIAVKQNTRESILAAFETRLTHGHATELRTALDEIDLIARLRLRALLEPPASLR